MKKFLCMILIFTAIASTVSFAMEDSEMMKLNTSFQQKANELKQNRSSITEKKASITTLINDNTLLANNLKNMAKWITSRNIGIIKTRLNSLNKISNEVKKIQIDYDNISSSINEHIADSNIRFETSTSFKTADEYNKYIKNIKGRCVNDAQASIDTINSAISKQNLLISALEKMENELNSLKTALAATS